MGLRFQVFVDAGETKTQARGSFGNGAAAVEYHLFPSGRSLPPVEYHLFPYPKWSTTSFPSVEYHLFP